MRVVKKKSVPNIFPAVSRLVYLVAKTRMVATPATPAAPVARTSTPAGSSSQFHSALLLVHSN